MRESRVSQDYHSASVVCRTTKNQHLKIPWRHLSTAPKLGYFIDTLGAFYSSFRLDTKDQTQPHKNSIP